MGAAAPTRITTAENICMMGFIKGTFSGLLSWLKEEAEGKPEARIIRSDPMNLTFIRLQTF
jgi:hypothetical protein